MGNNEYPDGVVIPNAHQYDRKGWGSGGEGELSMNRVMPGSMPGPGVRGVGAAPEFGTVVIYGLAVLAGVAILMALVKREKAR